MAIKFTNNATTTLAAGISNVATTATLATGTGALFPAAGAPDYFWATLTDNSGNIEIVKVTARSTDTVTITRAQEGTTGRAFSIGDSFQLRVTAQGLYDLAGERELAITAGTTSQYWRGDKSWQTLDKAAVGLGNAENTALSTWAGSANITTLGTIATGTWNATAVANTKGGTGQNSSAWTGLAKIASGVWSAGVAGTDYTSPTGTETLTNKTITAKALRETAVAMSALDIDLSAGNYFTKTLSTGSNTITVSNAVSGGSTVNSFILRATSTGASSITFGSGFTSVKYVNGSALSLTNGGIDNIAGISADGANWDIFIAKAMA